MANDAAQNKRLLAMTTHERLKTAWVKTKSKDEVIELIKDLNERQIDDLLAMCDKTVRDEVEAWLFAYHDHSVLEKN